MSKFLGYNKEKNVSDPNFFFYFYVNIQFYHSSFTQKVSV
jgi:hypothetical protein